MVLLSAVDVSKTFGDRQVLQKASLEIRTGERIGLVGPNGAGKTTLLRILTGQMGADAGTVEMPSRGTVGYLQQHPNFAESDSVWSVAAAAVGDVSQLASQAEQVAAELAQADCPELRQTLLEHYDRLQAKLHQADAYNWEYRVERILQGLGFPSRWNDRPARQLSGGQQNRLMLASLLLQQPDLMILDEPNNHLDIETTEWLEETLAGWPGALLVVSHDRFFLDQVASSIVELVDGQLDRYRGNYSAYVMQKAERLEVQRRTYERQQEEIAKLEEFIRKHHYGQKSTQAEDRRKKLERIERVPPPREIRTPQFRFPPAARSGDVVLRASELSKAYDRPLFSKLSFQIHRGERWAILGSNGSGKTTLLKCLLGQCQADQGQVELGSKLQIGYFDQLLSQLSPDTCAAEAIRVAHRDLDDRARRDILGAFGLSGDVVLKPLRMLSGGERSRTMLAWLTAMEANLLVLDEPTNHLDLWSRHALEEALRHFDGTVLMVTHDRYLVNAVADHVLVIGEGRVSQIAGNYDAYKHWLKQSMAIADRAAVGHNVAAGKSTTPGAARPRSGSPDTGSTKRKRKYPYRKVEVLAQEITGSEARIAEIHQQMMRPEILRDGRQVKQLQQELTGLEENLLQLYEHYEEACELN
ncbi:MAG: ABC-F family ATP-binding cassette domain-containing protein [Pirellulaceae bacterium]|nr:ABC-F family ATP-binding cassette domain-containing protein [Pirellulaceae bacterium]